MHRNAQKMPVPTTISSPHDDLWRLAAKQLARWLFLAICLTIQALPSLAAERVVLLKNGNLLQGQVQQLADETVVQTGTAELRVPSSDVKLVARSVRDVYEYKAARLSALVSSRAKLIRWCLKHDLVIEAQAELDQLGAKFPNDARLQLLSQNIAKHQTKKSPQAVLPSQSPLHPDLQFATTHISSLSNDTFHDYVRGVQPLLLNRCALAGCHGKSPQSTYRLLGHGRISRNLSNRNLGATLRQLGGPAEQSLLWMSASQRHGGMKRALSPAESNKLGAWIVQTTRELGVSVQSKSGVQQAAAQFHADGTDPFDPAEFNSLAD